ncbi:MAG: prenyltransferase/squalene oxidase repeat-containing protein [Methanoregula sp.]|jgi:hypothetical protein
MDEKNEIKEIISLSETNGGAFWSRHDGDIHAPNGFSTIDVLNTLGEIGIHASDSEMVSKAIDFLFTCYDGKGNFKYSHKSAALPCITARILTALGKVGYQNDPRIENCYEFFLESQQKDGGWRCATVKRGLAPETDASNPGTTLYVLDAFRFRKNPESDQIQLDKAVSFLLRHWETRLPLGPCRFGIGSRFLSIEYPFLRYNLFYYVYVLSKYGKALKDRRYQEALLILRKKAVDDKIFPETPHKSWNKFSFAQKNQYSEKATRRFLEIMEIQTR